MRRFYPPSGIIESMEWPELKFESWEQTYGTLHLYTQVIGKMRLAQTPWINHSWHVPLYITTKGLTTTPVRFGDSSVEFTFNLRDHVLEVDLSDGTPYFLPMESGNSVSDFYHDVLNILASAGLGVDIYPVPVELAEVTRFEKDNAHANYNADYANQLRLGLLRMLPVFQEFRARFTGKVSPIHFFWGSFDLAVTRFSGRTAPKHPGGAPHCADWVMEEAYSHELSSAGFYPGGGALPFPFFYSYAYPAPEGFKDAPVPEGAYFSSEMGEFVLPYDAVRQSANPNQLLLDFLQATYVAAADLGKWDRDGLDDFVDPRQTSA